MAEALSQAELARRLGVKRQAVNDLVKRQVLTLDADGKIDFESARTALLEQVRPSGKSTLTLDAAPAAPASAPAPAAPAAPESIATQDAAISLRNAKAMCDLEEARTKRVKRLRMEGGLIDKPAALQFAYIAARQVRDHLASRRRSLAPELATCSEIAQIDALLKASDQALLDNLIAACAVFLAAPQEALAA